MEFNEWLQNLKENAATPQVDYNTHKPTEGELNNLCHLSMRYTINWTMRHADFAIVRMMGGEPQTVRELDEKFIPELADYMWDHLMGEPETPTPEMLTEAIKVFRDMLYSMDEEVRNDTENKTDGTA
jgi:hypothetical protein